ncbi:MAG: hypothetical protein RTU92_06215, partial [Candidatus Thorarchaeota archaeon]
PEGQFESPDQFCLDVQSLLNERVYDRSITVRRFSDGNAIIISDPRGKVFHTGKYLVTDRVAELIDDADQMVSYLLGEAKIEQEYEAYLSIVWGPLLVIALFVPSALVYGYVRSQLYVMGGELSVIGLLLTFIFVYSAVMLMIMLVPKPALKRHDQLLRSRHPNHAETLTKLIDNGVTSSPGQPSFGERLESLKQSITKEESE